MKATCCLDDKLIENITNLDISTYNLTKLNDLVIKIYEKILEF